MAQLERAFRDEVERQRIFSSPEPSIILIDDTE